MLLWFNSIIKCQCNNKTSKENSISENTHHGILNEVLRNITVFPFQIPYQYYRANLVYLLAVLLFFFQYWLLLVYFSG